MTSLTFMLTLVLSQAPAQAQADGVWAPNLDGGQASSFSASLYATCPDAPPTEKLDGGWVLMPPERAARVACLMETCEAHRRRLETHVEEAASPWWWVAAVAATVAAGAAGFVLGRATSSADSGSGK
jgi:hypothetical protein